MKKYIYILAAVAALAACAKEANIADKNTPEETKISGKTVSFAISVEQQDTKSSLSSSGFAWEYSDRAAVYTTGGEKVILTPKANSIDGDKAIFTGTITDDNDGIPEGAIIVYPADWLSASTTITFPYSYDKPEDTKGPVLAAKLGSDRTSLSFKYVCQTIEFTITDIPSVATSLVMQTNQGFWGDSTISFDGSGNPSITTVKGNEITISLPASGSKTFRIPLPEATSFDCWMYLKKESNILLTKVFHTPSDPSPSRNSYYKLKDLAINPEVYMVSDMTSWDVGSKVQMTKSGTTATLTLNALANQHWRPIVVYPDGYWVYYGYANTDSANTSGTFSDITDEGTKMSALINTAAGNYTMSFNYVDGTYKATSTGTIADFYIAGSGKTSPQTMTKLSPTLAYNVRQWGNNGGTLYAYYNDNIFSEGGNYYVGSENYYLWVYNFSSNTLTATWSDCNFAGTWDFVKFKSSSDSWVEHSMERITGTPAWKVDVELSANSEFGFEAQGPDGSWGPAWQGNANDPMTDNIASYCPAISKVGNNYKVATGGKYTIIFFESNRFAILNRD